MRLAIYAHPFDLDALRAQGGLSRLRDLGFAEIAMATSYHDGRWLTPWHPQGRVRFLEDGTVHFRPRGDYGTLRPEPSREVPASLPSPLERLCSEALPLGLAVRAWNVFTHNSRLGVRHPELCVQNAFGDRYTYALCPAQPLVQQYIVAMTKDLAAHPGLSAIEFEALGWMGWKHGSHHDKASFAPRGLLDHALSLCLCARCCELVRDAGGDPERTRAWIRSVVRAAIEDADAMSPPGAEPGDAVTALAAIRGARAAVIADLGRRLADVSRPGVALAVQVHPSPLFTGSQLPLSHATGVDAAEHVFTTYGDDVAAIGQALEAPAGGHRATRRRVSIWPKAPQFRGDDDLVQLRELLAAKNVASVAIYHLGLLPWRTIERVAKILRA